MTFEATLEPDDPVELDADFQLDGADRRYVDNQIRAIQQMLADLLVKGRQGTMFLVDSGSSALAAGDCVCGTPNATTGDVVTKATAAALALAGRPSGIVLEAAQPGTRCRVATFGIVPPSVTGLTSAGFVRVNTTTARCEIVSSLSPTDYSVGRSDAAGNLTLGLGEATLATGSDDGDVLGWDGSAYWVVRGALRVLASSVQFTTGTVEFHSTVATPTFAPADRSSAGTPFTVRGQRSTASNGGRMEIGGGQGHSSANGGNLDLYSGAGGTSGIIREFIGGPNGTGTLIRKVGVDGTQDLQGNALTNFHHAIASEDPAQTVYANATPGYVPLWVNGGADSVALSALGFPVATAGVRPADVVKFRVTWRYDSTTGVEVADNVEVNVRMRYNAASDYRGAIWAPSDGDPSGVSESATANAAVTTDVTGDSGAEYRITLSPEAGGAHTIAISMKQHTTTNRVVTTETWRGPTIRNLVS